MILVFGACDRARGVPLPWLDPRDPLNLLSLLPYTLAKVTAFRDWCTGSVGWKRLDGLLRDAK